ncbi:hypothetical protein MHYP_G00039750 [Metynnis hypsauchen]
MGPSSEGSFYGRLRHFLDVIDPQTLFVSESHLNECVKLLEHFRDGTLPAGVTNAQLWEAQKVKQVGEGSSSVEGKGVTHYTIPTTSRPSSIQTLEKRSPCPFACQVVGLLLPNQTLATTIFWQWLNQSHNACVNYCNRNASKPTPFSKFFQGYLGAVSSAVTIAVGLNVLIQRAKRFRPNKQLLVQRFVPFPAVASANVCNVLLMCHSELSEGVSVLDENGNVVGTSKIAARCALLETAVTRGVLPMPILVLPPMLMTVLESLPLLQRHPRLVLPVHSLVCLCAFGLALLLAISLFPQNSQIHVSQLEPEISAATECKILTYNKGL